MNRKTLEGLLNLFDNDTKTKVVSSLTVLGLIVNGLADIVRQVLEVLK